MAREFFGYYFLRLNRKYAKDIRAPPSMIGVFDDWSPVVGSSGAVWVMIGVVSGVMMLVMCSTGATTGVISGVAGGGVISVAFGRTVTVMVFSTVLLSLSVTR